MYSFPVPFLYQILHLATRANFVVPMPFAFPSVGDVTDTPTARISRTNEIAVSGGCPYSAHTSGEPVGSDAGLRFSGCRFLPLRGRRCTEHTCTASSPVAHRSRHLGLGGTLVDVVFWNWRSGFVIGMGALPLEPGYLQQGRKGKKTKGIVPYLL